MSNGEKKPGPEVQLPLTRARAAPGRFVISHRRAGFASHEERVRSREKFDAWVDTALKGSEAVVSDFAAARLDGRRTLTLQGSLAQALDQAEDIPPEVLIETARPRVPAVARSLEVEAYEAAAGPVLRSPGTGAKVRLTLLCNRAPLVKAQVSLYLLPVSPQAGNSTMATAVSDEQGRVSFDYNPQRWQPSGAMLTPAGKAWSCLLRGPRDEQTVEVPELPRTGPLGWWHLLVGATDYSESRGAGIRIGVVDTGVGPHPYLSHVTPIGAYLDNGHDSSAKAGEDARDHGTHVSGLIAARPPVGSGDFSGVAPGAEVFVARVFTPAGGGFQDDIANAIEALVVEHQVDLINLSLAGEPSEIERDAIRFALEQGTLCICAAGNGNGAPVSCPAAYPEAVAVSALGLMGVTPPDSVAAMFVPQQPDRVLPNGVFLASFSNVGPQMACTAPGDGVISTVPANAAYPAPYVDMSGTSLAAPLTTAALAVLLSNDAQYKALPRNLQRALYARQAVALSAIPLGLSPSYQGSGLARERWPWTGTRGT